MTPTAPCTSVRVAWLSRYGILLWLDAERLFLSFEAFPWFRGARLAKIMAVEQTVAGQLRWLGLDVVLTVDAIRHPHRYPLVSRALDG
jgi:hypothetical protein